MLDSDWAYFTELRDSNRINQWIQGSKKARITIEEKNEDGKKERKWGMYMNKKNKNEELMINA